MPTRPAPNDTRSASTRIGTDDPRYRAVVDKRFNKRFSARPDYVRLVGSTDQVVSAVEEAVREGRRLAERIKARWDPRDVFRHALSIRGDRWVCLIGSGHSARPRKRAG